MSRRNIVLAAVGVVLVLLAGYFFLIRPRQSELSEVQEQVEAEQALTTQLQIELQRREQLQENAPQLRAELAEIRELVPQEDQVANFIFQVQEAADKSGVGFLQITPELPKPPPELAQVAEVRVAIRAKGGYFAIQDFMRRLYDLDRALRIDLFTFSGVDDEEEAATEGRVEMSATARIFFELPAAAATTTTTTGTTPAPPPAGATPTPTPTTTP